MVRRCACRCPSCEAAIPKQYPIRDYPDITHSLRCQYPVPDWDVAYALTEGPRSRSIPGPSAKATIFHAFADSSVGFITYSEGCNDDVNKIVWSSLGWDPDGRRHRHPAPLRRYFIDDRSRTASPTGCWPSSGTGRDRS